MLGFFVRQGWRATPCPCFTVRRATVDRWVERNEDAFFYGVVIRGSGTLKTAGEAVHLARWDRFFCPAGVDGFRDESELGMNVIACGPGGSSQG